MARRCMSPDPETPPRRSRAPRGRFLGEKSSSWRGPLGLRHKELEEEGRDPGSGDKPDDVGHPRTSPPGEIFPTICLGDSRHRGNISVQPSL
jgi:hypothetical protein